MTYQALLQQYQRERPGGPGGDDFNNWVIQRTGTGNWDEIPDNFFTTNPTPAANTTSAPAAGGGDSTLEGQLQAYFSSNPAFAAEYERVKAGGDQRSPIEWMYDHLQNSPADLTKFQAQVNTSLGTNVDATGGQPLEQALLGQFLPGLLADAGNDEQRRQLVDQLTKQLTGNFTTTVNALSPEANAARLAAELDQAGKTGAEISSSAATSAADQQKALEDAMAARRNALAAEIAALRGAFDTQSAARRAALQTELDQLTAAQAPLSKARLDTANALASGINLGLEDTTDRLTAERAKQGYIGTSTFDNNALARATIGARQQAAQALGSARELNAGDVRAIGAHGATEGRTIADELAANLLNTSGREATEGRTLADLLATGGQGIATNLATQQQGARDSTTLARQGYFDNAYTRGIGQLLTIPGLTTSLTGSLGALDNYGQSGMNRALSALNWWNTNQGAAPTAGYTPLTADTSGNDIAGLGAGLLGAGLKYAQGSDWWRTPTTPAPKTTAPATTTAPSSSSDWTF